MHIVHLCRCIREHAPAAGTVSSTYKMLLIIVSLPVVGVHPIIFLLPGGAVLVARISLV